MLFTYRSNILQIILAVAVTLFIFLGFNYSFYLQNILGVHVGLQITSCICITYVLRFRVLFPIDRLSISLYLFVILGLITTIYSSDSGFGLLLNKDLMQQILGILFFVFTYNAVKHNENIIQLIVTFTFYVNILLVIDFLYYSFFHSLSYDSNGLLISEHLLAVYLLLTTALYLQFCKIRWIDYILIAGYVIIVFFTESRAAIFTLLLLLTAYYCLVNTYRLTSRGIIYGSIVLGAIFLGLLYINVASVVGRRILLEIGISMINASNFIFGNGVGFVEYKIDYYQSLFFQNQPIHIGLYGGQVKTILNEHLKIIIENGILGYALLVFVVVYSGVVFYKEKLNWLLASLCGFVVFALFSNPLYATPIACVLVLYFAIASVKLKKYIVFSNKVGKFGIIALFLLLGSWQVVLLKNIYTWKKLSFIPLEMTSKTILDNYANLERILGSYSYYLNDYSTRLQQMERYQEARIFIDKSLHIHPTLSNYMNSGYNYEMLKNYHQAEKDYLFAINIQPKLFYPKYLLFDMYRAARWEDKAKSWGREILEFPVKITHPDVDEIKNEVENYLIQNQ